MSKGLRQVESEELVKELVDCIDRNASGLIDKEEFVKALQNPEELLAKPEEKKEQCRRANMAFRG